MLTSLVPKTFSLSPVYMCNLVFDFCSGGQFSMLPHSLLWLAPVSTTIVTMIILFQFMNIVTQYGFSHLSAFSSTWNMVYPTSYLLIPIDMYVCHIPGLYLTVAFSFQSVTGDHFILTVTATYQVSVSSNSNISSIFFSNKNGILPFSECTGLAYDFLHDDSIYHLFLSIVYSRVIFLTHLFMYPISNFPPHWLTFTTQFCDIISEWSPFLELFRKLS